MRIELTLLLERDTEIDGPAHEIADELIRLGGWMTSWQSERLCPFGCATFVFADKADRNRFLKAALRVPGVHSDLNGREGSPDPIRAIIAEAGEAFRRAVPS